MSGDLKFNAAGNALVFSTFLGGPTGLPTFDYGAGIAVDAGGNVYVTGTAGPGFPTTAGAAQPVSGGNQDAFVTKYTPAGVVVYSTYVGGAGQDWANSIAVKGGNAFITGKTASANFPTTAGAYKTVPPSGSCVFVT